MKMHLIFDFMHIYYKNFFTFKTGRTKRLTYKDKDVTVLYHTIKDIEKARKEWTDKGFEVTVSVCFDSKSSRNEINDDYKANRKSSLTDAEYAEIDEIREMLSEVGYNVVKVEGYEADDLVAKLAKQTRNDFENVIIYTNDKDVMINIDEVIYVEKFKPGKGYELIGKKNFEDVLFEQMKTYIPYNLLGLYLCTVGDICDGIKGIKGFGNSAFSKLVEKIERANINVEELGNFDNLQRFIESYSDLFGINATEALESLQLVRNIELDDIAIVIEGDSLESRQKVYERYEMKSLYKE